MNGPTTGLRIPGATWAKKSAFIFDQGLSQSGSRYTYAPTRLPSFSHEPFNRLAEILDAAVNDYPVSDDLWHGEMLPDRP